MGHLGDWCRLRSQKNLPPLLQVSVMAAATGRFSGGTPLPLIETRGRSDEVCPDEKGEGKGHVASIFWTMSSSPQRLGVI